MKKLIYIFIAILSLGIISCESEYDDGLDVAGTRDAYVLLASTTDKIATETKSISVTIRRYIPIYEDVTVNYQITGDFTVITGTTVFPALTGQTGGTTHTFDVTIPASVVPAGAVSTPGVFTLLSSTTASGKTIAAGLDGASTSFNMTINKYVPLDRGPFLGDFVENDGSDDYLVTITADPDNEFGLIITGGNWGATAEYKVAFNTITNETLVENQFIGVNYFDAPDASAYDAVWYAPASDGSTGTFDTSTGVFTVIVNMGLPNYPYDFGDVLLSYSK